MDDLAALVPVALFLAFAVGLSVVVRRRARAASDGGGFVKEYFIGNRGLGGFVLAMTTIATYGSVSSFVGGPGQAWSIGFGWVYMAVVQVTALVLLYGIVGKKMALIARKLDAITVADVIRARYASNALANFGVAVILFTTIGGFRGVALTDALCGIAMLVGIVVLAAGILDAGGGYEAIMGSIAQNHPEMLEPTSGGNIPPSLYLTQWLLVGVFTFVLPQSVVRTMGYKDVKSLHRAMIVGTVIIGAMMIGVTALGVLAAGVLTEDLAAYGGSVDNIIPLAISRTLPPVLAGIAIIGPVAASISTVSSLLISSSSALVKDVWMHYAEARGRRMGERALSVSSQAVTLGLGAVVFVLAVVPPDVIWKINMFAFGGLETAFFWVMVCGLFWKRANRTGALWSMAGGTLAYCATMALGFKVADLHQIVIGIVVAGVCMVAGSLAGKQAPASRMEVFFPDCDSGAEAANGSSARRAG